MNTNGQSETKWSKQLSDLPSKLKDRLMPFQREGVEFALSRNGRCMIADEMGLGKTVQAIAAAYAYREEWPLLVVVPSSLRYPWIEELERWIPKICPGDVNLVESKSDTTGIPSSKVTVVGYGLMTTDARVLVEALTRQKFGVVLVDESHYLKTRNAARTTILVPLIQNAKRAILLTGTPALGRPEELFMQIEALYPRMFGSWSDFAKKYCNAHYRYFGKRRQWDCRGASNLEELHARLGDIMIRRLKKEVLSQLPPKIRQRIPFTLPRDVAKEACASFEEWEKLMRGLGSGAVDADNPFTEVMSLVTRMYKQTAIAKAGAVKDYIKMMLETEELKFLVFAHHLTMLQACTEAAIEAKVGYIRIDGSVPSSERIQLVHKFQGDPDVRVAILSIQAAGQGLTFTAASHVVFAELYWNPGHMKQAEDRAHRIGQTCSVHIHYLIAKGTFDTVMWSMLNRKETVTGSTLNGQKGVLESEVGDKDKWDFLNFATAWTPSELLPPLQAGTGNDKDAMFFSHFEKDKQHDIRSFFSPNAKEKKRKKPEDEDTPPPVPSVEEDGDKGSPKKEEGDEEKRMEQDPEDQDFSPEVKRLRTAQVTPRQKSRLTGKRRSAPGPGLVSSPLASLLAPRRLSERPVPPVRERWSCGTCTYSNYSLLSYCEMCESPRLPKAPPAASTTSLASPHARHPPGGDQACVTERISLATTRSPQSAIQGKHSPGLQTDEPPKDKQRRRASDEEEGEEGDEGDEGKQSPGERGDGDGSEPTQGNPTGQAEGDRAVGPDEKDDPASHFPVHTGLKFCASQHTDRIYLYSKDGESLSCNFVPLDIKLDNWEDLPEAFSQQQDNRSQVVRFVREWCGLPAMKQRLLRRSGALYHSPCLGLEQLASTQRPHSSTKRYLGRDEVALASLDKAQETGGSIRVVTKDNFFSKRRSASSLSPSTPGRQDKTPSGSEQETPSEASPGAPAYLQALDSQGVPLCLSCQETCPSSGGPWDTRFCSQRCQEDFQLRSSQSFMRARVLEAEQGVCQHCGLQAHQLYLRMRDSPPSQRKEVLENTWLAQLPLKQLNEMIRAPVEGDFWQVDHIKPVFRGGGQCSLDNLQTLCTVCHRTRTAHQAKERSQLKKGQTANRLASDITRFFIKK